MNKSFKFRIYPNEVQIQLIEQTFGNCRFVYNYYLAKRIELYKSEKKSFNYYSCANDLKTLKSEPDKEWLKLTDSTAYQNCLKDLEKAYQMFFKVHSGFPKFKKKKENRKSYCTTNNSNSIKQVDNKYIQIPILGKVRCKFSRNIEGRILSATISKNPSGKYFVSLCCEVGEILPLEKTGSMIGIDLGIKDFAITSNGDKYDNPKYLATSSQKLAKLQRELSRKQIGSSNWEKQRIKVARCYEHITNQRNDFLQKLSTQLIKKNDVICLETLKVKNMVKNHRLAKAILDCSWSEFVRMLDYKAEWYGKQIVKIDTYYPSSKTCSNCGYKYEGLTLDIREWTCPDCGTKYDRDVNAAINILNQGLKQLQ